MKGDREQRRVVVRRLLGIREDLGEVPNEAVDAAAHMLGLSRRQVRRLVANGGDGDARDPFDLTEKMIDFLFAARGNAWRAHELLIDAGVALPVGPRQFQRAVEQRVDQALVAGARRGLDGVMAATVYLGRPVAHRNDIWAIDHTPAPVAVRPADGGSSRTSRGHDADGRVDRDVDRGDGQGQRAERRGHRRRHREGDPRVHAGRRHLRRGAARRAALRPRRRPHHRPCHRRPGEGPGEPPVHRAGVAVAGRQGRADAGALADRVGHRPARLPVR